MTGKEIVSGFFEAFGAGDMDQAMGLLKADVRWTFHAPGGTVPWSGTFTGPEGVGRFFELFLGAAEPIEMTPEGMWEENGTVFVRGVERTRIKATGKEYSARWLHMVTTDNGQIASLDEHIDSAAVAAAFG